MELTPSQQIIWGIMLECDREGKPMPNNFDLAAAIGASSISTASKALTRLQDAGLIQVERFSNCRRITFSDTGRQLVSANWLTANPALPGHWPRQQYESATSKREARAVAIRVEERARIDALRAPPIYPCARCAVRSDHHDSLGCAQFVERVAA